jgi:hypothetical protein
MSARIYKFLILILFAFAGGNSRGQDIIFLRENDVLLECVILNTNDSLLFFRLLDPSDTLEYEIPMRLTYGFLLESQALEKGLKSEAFQLEFLNANSKRRPIFREKNLLFYKLKGDTAEMPRRGRLIEIRCDSVFLEYKRKRKPERSVFALNDFVLFGYSTPTTEFLTLLLAPVSALKDGSFFIYRKLDLIQGWTFRCSRAPDQVSRFILKRYPKKRRPQKLPITLKTKRASY